MDKEESDQNQRLLSSRMQVCGIRLHRFFAQGEVTVSSAGGFAGSAA